MSRRLWIIWLGLLFLAGSAPGWAQENGDEVVVYGKPFEDVVRQFVGELSGAPEADDQMARWDRSVCPGILGLKDVPTARRLIDRLAVRAFELELDVGEPGCEPNILVFFTDDPPALTSFLRSQIEPVLNERNISTLGRRALAAFTENVAPVRWWSFAATKSRLGLDIGSDLAVRDLSPSRVRRLTRQDLSKIVIVVDARLTSNLRVGALGDYLAMVSLAQIDPEADTRGLATILNLFNDGPSEMTEWDKAYLAGLYGATRAARSINQQEGEIRRAMMRKVEKTANDNP